MLKLLFSPDESSGTTEEVKPLGVEETLDFLNKEDEEKKEEEVIELKDEKEVKEDEEEDEIKKIEEELKEEEEDPEKYELVTPVAKREILAKYPSFFKDFPGVEASYYRDKQFTEIIGTPADAKVAVEKANTLDNFEADLAKGNLETTLKVINSFGENTFNKMVDDYLPTLAKVNNDAYLVVVGNIAKTIANSMIRNAKGNDDDLAIAARIMNKYITGREEIDAPVKLAKVEERNEKEEALNKKEQELFNRQFESARDRLSTKVDNIIKGTIAANIDPKKSMSDYTREKATDDALNEVERLIDEDKSFGRILDKLWQSAAKNDFNDSSMNRIKGAYLSKAKQLLLPVLKGVRAKASKDSISPREEIKEDRKGPIETGRSRSTTRSSGSKTERELAREIPSNMSSRDFMMKD